MMGLSPTPYGGAPLRPRRLPTKISMNLRTAAARAGKFLIAFFTGEVGLRSSHSCPKSREGGSAL